MSGLGLTFLRRGNLAHPTAGSDYILSENRGDPEVFRILMSKGVSSDGVGITREDAEKLTSFNMWFRGNTLIQEFPESVYFTNVRVINQNEFNGCTSLKTFDFSNVKELLGSSFAGCPLEIDALRTPLLEVLAANVFPNAFIRKWVDMGRLTELPVTPSYATYGRRDILEEIHFPNTLQGFAKNAMASFANYTSLRYVYFANITDLPSSTFRGCTSLDASTIPFEQFTSIGEQAFGNCNMTIPVLRTSSMTTMIKDSFLGNNIEKWLDMGKIASVLRGGTSYYNYGNRDAAKVIRYPATVTSVGVYAVYEYRALEAIIFDSVTPPTLTDNTTFNNSSACPIYVPDGSVAAYKSANLWSNVANRIKPISEYTE